MRQAGTSRLGFLGTIHNVLIPGAHLFHGRDALLGNPQRPDGKEAFKSWFVSLISAAKD